MIDRHHALSISRQARLASINRGSVYCVYYLPKPINGADLVLMRRIDALHLEHPFMGACMLATSSIGRGTILDASTLAR